MHTATCLDREQLQSFSLGYLSETEAEQIEKHLQQCPVCEETLAGLEDATDSLLRQMRSPRQGSRYESDQHYRQALRRAQAISGDAVQPVKSARDVREANPLIPDRLLRDYRLVGVLGQGGMGTVYKAIHTRLEMPVAVKVLPERRMRDLAAVARFQREMRAIGKLDHPAIVRATDAGQVEDTHFLVMELVEGVDLGRLVKYSKPLEIADACEMIRQAAIGIQHAHDQGIIHRDMKPSNLMLSERGQVKILDLGLALLGGLQSPVDELTTVGQLMGTLDYMAPEQCDASQAVTETADVYGLGATLYKMISGEAPYSGPQFRTPLQKLKALGSVPVPPISERRLGVPADLEKIIHKALANHPSERFASAGGFAEALAPFTAGCDLALLGKQAAVRMDAEVSIGSNQSNLALPDGPRTNPDAPLHRFLEPEPATIRHSTWIWPLVATLATVLLILAGLIIYLETGKGTLMIECASDNVAVTIKKSGKFYDSIELKPGTNSTRIGAGNYEIQLEGKTDGIVLENGRFELRRGESWIARIVEQKEGDAHDLRTSPATQDLQPRYEGQTFGQWLKEVKTEQSPVRKAKAISALFTLAKDEQIGEAVRAVVGNFRRSDSYVNVEDGFQTMLSFLQSSLYELPQSTLADAVVNFLTDGSSDERFLILNYIDQSSARSGQSEAFHELKPAILVATQDHDADVRALAISALAKLKPFNEAFQRRLIELIDDKNERVAATAATALVVVNPDYATLARTLQRFTESGDDTASRNLALRGFIKLGKRDQAAIEFLMHIVDTDQPEFREPSWGGYPLPDASNMTGFGGGGLGGGGLGGGGLGGGGLGGGGLGGAFPGSDSVQLFPSQFTLQELAIDALGNLGPDARAAMPVLKKELERRMKIESDPQELQKLGGGGGFYVFSSQIVAAAIAKIEKE